MDEGRSAEPGPGTSVAKRRACVSCTSTKTKCSRRVAGGDCERCARLGKRCTFLDLPQRTRRQRGTRRMEGLEARLEELVTRVSALDRDKNGVDDTTLSATTLSPRRLTTPLERPTPHTHTSLSSVDISSSKIPSSPALGTSATSPNVSDGYVDLVDRRIITPERAEALLAEFNIHHATLFPFVVLDNGVDASMLRRNAPLLFLVVISVALRSDPSLQRLLGEEIQARISSKLIGSRERSLESLQALLVYLAWRYCFTEANGDRDMFAMMQLCAAMVYDLALEKSSAASLAEKRALLGAYWLSAGLSRSLRRPPVMQMSKHMEECCRHLATAGKYHTDKLIEPLVLLSSLAGRVGEMFSYSDVVYTSVRGNSGVSMAADAFFHELQIIKRLATAGGDSDTDNSMVDIELDYTESYILEVAFHHEIWETANRTPCTDTSRGCSKPSITPSRAAMLWRMLDSNKSCIQTFMRIHDSFIARLPYTVFWRLCYVLASLIRLTFTIVESTLVSDRTARTQSLSIQETPDENRSIQTAQQIAEEINLTQIIDNLAAKFERAVQASVAGTIKTNDNLAPFITKLRKLSLAYPKKLRNAIGGVSTFAVETELMPDCQPHRHIQGSHWGRTEQPCSGVPGDGSQVRLAEEVQNCGDGNSQTDDWPLLDGFAGPEWDDMEWESIMQAFTIPP